MEDDDFVDFEEGPFCRHWSDPSDCEEVCKQCGHYCKFHHGGCNQQDCECEEFVDAEE